ncbi:MAG TPA: hypothetical protein VK072_01840 [Candidatus Avamphibacillus sp.]|nr:hypothetical protein [Candidatus Avamphibacillus sp.]
MKNNRIIAIMRGLNSDDAGCILHFLKKGGIKVFEVTLDSPKAYEIIEQLSIEVDEDILMGQG